MVWLFQVIHKLQRTNNWSQLHIIILIELTVFFIAHEVLDLQASFAGWQETWTSWDSVDQRIRV